MPAPWEKYASAPPADGPWAKYGSAAPPAPQELTPKPPAKEEPTFGSRLYETTAKPFVDLYSAVSDRAAKTKGSPLAALGEVGLETITGTAKDLYKRYSESEQTKAGNYLGGIGETLVRPIVEPVYQDVKAGNYGAAAGGVAGNVASAYLPKGLGRLVEEIGVPTAKAIQRGTLKAPAKMTDQAISRMVDESLESGVTATNTAKSGALRKEGAKAVGDRVAAGDAAGLAIDPEKAAQRIDSVVGKFAAQSDNGADLAKIESKRRAILEQAGATPAGQVGTSGAKPMSFSEAQSRKTADYAKNAKQYTGSPDAIPAAEAETLAAYDRGIREEMEALDPTLGPLNQTLGARIDLDKVVRRVARQQANANVPGFMDFVAGALGGYAGGVEGALTAYAARKVLTNPAIRSRLAISIYDGAKAAGQAIPFAEATTRAGRVIGALMPESGAEKQLREKAKEKQ